MSRVGFILFKSSGKLHAFYYPPPHMEEKRKPNFLVLIEVIYLGQKNKEFMLHLNSAPNGLPLIVSCDCRVLLDFCVFSNSVKSSET